MARDRLSWFKFYATDFLLDDRVGSLPRELRGVLVSLWAVACDRGGIPSDRLSWVGRQVDATPEEVQRLLDEFFELGDDGVWFSPRMEREWKARKTDKNRRSEAGKKGAEARWGGRNAIALPPQSDVDPNQKQKQSTEVLVPSTLAGHLEDLGRFAAGTAPPDSLVGVLVGASVGSSDEQRTTLARDFTQLGGGTDDLFMLWRYSQRKAKKNPQGYLVRMMRDRTKWEPAINEERKR